MGDYPVSAEIATALASFFFGGQGPRHAQLTSVFEAAGYGEDAPYDPTTQKPNKEQRVMTVVTAAARRPARSRALIDGLLALMRADGCFSGLSDGFDSRRVQALQDAFRRAGFILSSEGELTEIAAPDLRTGGRAALEEQLRRLRRADGDPALEVGTAKDLLEAVGKFVLAELGWPLRSGSSFDEIWHHTRDRLGILPQQMDPGAPGGAQARKIAQSAWTIVEQVNELRGLQGTGHGRTLPSTVSNEMARLVVREACSVADFVLATLDRTVGRRQD